MLWVKLQSVRWLKQGGSSTLYLCCRILYCSEVRDGGRKRLCNTWLQSAVTSRNDLSSADWHKSAIFVKSGVAKWLRSLRQINTSSCCRSRMITKSHSRIKRRKRLGYLVLGEYWHQSRWADEVTQLNHVPRWWLGDGERLDSDTTWQNNITNQVMKSNGIMLWGQDEKTK